jgi:hypothetical protein
MSDTIEMIEAESQAVLNSLTEHEFQDALKQWQKCVHWKGDYLECDGGQLGPKLVFDQMAAQVLEIMEIPVLSLTNTWTYSWRLWNIKYDSLNYLIWQI